MSFEEIAEQRGISAAKTRLGELPWDVEPTAYQELTVPPGAPLEPLLELIARRTLDPAFMTILLDQFPARPLEHALIAYDIAAGSLLGPGDEALFQRVCRALAPLKQVGAQGLAAVPRERIPALIEAARADTGPAGDMPSLAALAQATEPPTDAIIAHAKVLARAHLPSLALAFLQILWERFGTPQALDLLIETTLDHDMFASLPAPASRREHSLQQQLYFLVRVNLANFNVVAAKRGFDTFAAKIETPDPTLVLARAELALMCEETVDVSTIDKLATLEWRYSQRVLEAARMRRTPEDSLIYLDGFTTYFGNDAWLWAHARDNDDMRAATLPLVARELRYASHDPNVWRAVAIFIEDGEPVGTELDARMTAQLAQALS